MKRKRELVKKGESEKKRRKQDINDKKFETTIKKAVLEHDRKEFERMSKIRKAMFNTGGVVRIVNTRYIKGKSMNHARVATKIVKERIFQVVSHCKRRFGEVTVENLNKLSSSIE